MNDKVNRQTAGAARQQNRGLIGNVAGALDQPALRPRMLQIRVPSSISGNLRLLVVRGLARWKILAIR
jgi:hypothetical protein